MRTKENTISATQLSTELLLKAYSLGIFPMAESNGGEIFWYSPDPRTILPLDNFKVSRSLRQIIRKKLFEVRFDTAFEKVICGCAQRNETWISEEIIRSYTELFFHGFAHSVEVWRNEKLVGGLYGVSVGAAFFGESMFSVERDASKVALYYLIERLKEKQFELLDTQYTTEHLKHFGAIEISRQEYLIKLSHAIANKITDF